MLSTVAVIITEQVAKMITGSIAHSAKRQHSSYSEANFSPHMCNNKDIGPQNWKFYWNITTFRNMPCRGDFMKFAEFVPRYMMS